jgi:hypothetical protein
MECLCCRHHAEVGRLCRDCAQQVAPCDGLIAEHVRSTVSSMDADAWLVDGFGAPHPVAARTAIGRNHDAQLVVLSASVSREHAELRRTSEGWILRDLGSRNGTAVDGARCQARVTLPPRAIVKVGDVALWFLAEVSEEPASARPPETVTIQLTTPRFVLRPGGRELCLVAESGMLLARDRIDAAWQDCARLAPLEGQLLAALCARAIAEADSPSPVRGCYSSKQLAADLTFQARYANEENVRQVVRRLRGVLADAGADGILGVRPGHGYYLTCPVAPAGAAR